MRPPIFNRDILAIGSEVLYALFYKELADNEKTIDISDTDTEAFRLMIR